MNIYPLGTITRLRPPYAAAHSHNHNFKFVAKPGQSTLPVLVYPGGPQPR